MDLERDFAAWADGRDAGALGRVFDATAGRLLLLAAHLTGDGAAAEDLVQATFLAAMARGATWDRSRALWPWLAAILHNEAQMAWRRQRRRREVGIEEAAVCETPAPGPQQLAASEEALAAVTRAIDELPLAYRQVLRLRLVHGLEPIAIARALELPAGTVRAQLHRGLAQLREALPKGVAVAIAGLLAGSGEALAQVRARVLAQATALRATAGVGVGTSGLLLTGGVLLVKAKTWGIVAAVAAALLLSAYFGWVAPSSAVEREGGTAPGPAASAEPGTQPRGEGRPVERAAVDAAAGPAWPLTVSVRTSAGVPVEGAGVRVSVVPRGLDHEWLRFEEPLALGTTKNDGTFRCSLDGLRERTMLLRRTSWLRVVAASERADAAWQLLELPRTNEARPFALELTFQPLPAIVGRAVDGAGRPIRGATVHCLGAAPGTWPGRDPRARTGADGRFAFHLGSHELEPLRSVVVAHPASGAGMVELPARTAPVGPAATIDAGTIVLRDAASIRGRVVLGDGSALGDHPLFVWQVDAALADDRAAVMPAFFVEKAQLAPLRVHGGRVFHARAQPRTDDDGSFVCAGLDPEGVYAVGVRDTMLQVVFAVTRPLAEPVHLVVDRQLVRVAVRGEAGEPLPGAGVMTEGFDPSSSAPALRVRPGFPDKRASSRTPSGFYPIDAQGRRLLLSPIGWTWFFSIHEETAEPDFVRHEVVAGVYRADVTVVQRPAKRFGALRLAVVDERGQPLSYGFVLRCLDRDLVHNFGRSVLPPEFTIGDLSAGRWRLTVHMGKEVLYHPALEAFYARGAHEQEIVIEDGRTAEVEVVARPAGRVAFQLRSSSPPASGAWPGLKFQAEADGSDVAYHVLFPMAGLPHTENLFPAQRAFAPGKHAFRVTATGYHTTRCEVEVVADRLAQVAVEMVKM